MEETIFYKYPEKLMRATGYIHPSSGELIELTANEKNIYVVMKKRNSFFDKHFDKQEDISELSGVSLKQTGRILRSFIDNEIIVANKGSSGQHKNWRYEKVAPLNLYQQKTQGLSKEFIELGVVEEDFWKSEMKPAKKVNEWRAAEKVKSAYTPPAPNWDDEEGLPF